MKNDNKDMRYREVVINKCFGGFRLSHEAVMLYAKFAGFKLYPFVKCREKRGKEWSPQTSEYKPFTKESDKDNPYDIISYSRKPIKDGKYENKSYFSEYFDIPRDDPALVKVVRKLKEKSFGQCAELKIVKIPANIKWVINDYDGMESIEEEHKSWG